MFPTADLRQISRLGDGIAILVETRGEHGNYGETSFLLRNEEDLRNLRALCDACIDEHLDARDAKMRRQVIASA
jgi:hypothetical protein